MATEDSEQRNPLAHSLQDGFNLAAPQMDPVVAAEDDVEQQLQGVEPTPIEESAPVGGDPHGDNGNVGDDTDLHGPSVQEIAAAVAGLPQDDEDHVSMEEQHPRNQQQEGQENDGHSPASEEIQDMKRPPFPSPLEGSPAEPSTPGEAPTDTPMEESPAPELPAPATTTAALPPAQLKPAPPAAAVPAPPQTSESLVQLLHRLRETVERQSTTIQKQTNKIKRQQRQINQLNRALSEYDGKKTKKKYLTSEECAEIVERNKMERWEKRCKELSDFKLVHGHCNVPKSHVPRSLHSWVIKQRMDKKKMDAGMPCGGMNNKRAEILTRMGFQWTIGQQHKHDAWDSMYRELMKFMAKNGGSSNVPTSYSVKLNKWVQNQRHRKRLLETVGPSGAIGMSWHRVEKLNDIGFAWDGAKEFKRKAGHMP